MKPNRVAIARAKVEMRVKQLGRVQHHLSKAMEGCRKHRPDGLACVAKRLKVVDSTGYREAYEQVADLHSEAYCRMRKLLDYLNRD